MHNAPANIRITPGYRKEFDNEASLQEARLNLPIKRIMEQHRIAPSSGRWKSFTCPFCQKKAKAAVFKRPGSEKEYFKCFYSGCPSGTAERAFDEIGLLAHISNLNRKEAFVAYLKQAGVWKEREQFKSTEAGTTRSLSPSNNSVA